jgi:hypothetical protein
MAVVLVIGVIVVGLFVAAIGDMARSQTIDAWARENQLEILRRESRQLLRGPYCFSGKGYRVYYISARTPQGTRRHGYLRVGRSFPFLPYRIDVSWD